MAERYQSRAKKSTKKFPARRRRGGAGQERSGGAVAAAVPCLTQAGWRCGRSCNRRSSTCNPIASCLSTVERVARNVKRWHGGDQPLRWTATGLLEAERKFRKGKAYGELPALHRKLNPSLTQQAQVA